MRWCSVRISRGERAKVTFLKPCQSTVREYPMTHTSTRCSAYLNMLKMDASCWHVKRAVLEWRRTIIALCASDKSAASSAWTSCRNSWSLLIPALPGAASPGFGRMICTKSTSRMPL